MQGFREKGSLKNNMEHSIGAQSCIWTNCKASWIFNGQMRPLYRCLTIIQCCVWWNPIWHTNTKNLYQLSGSVGKVRIKACFGPGHYAVIIPECSRGKCEAICVTAKAETGSCARLMISNTPVNLQQNDLKSKRIKVLQHFKVQHTTSTLRELWINKC